ncbi:hypothetical protein [Mesorhizobium sp.]|uniref:hypothetical protein n=1 Tax=Mesorhizobium sp. TaxID=1871066 RepID=UPI00121EEFBB|nr:hypothetical protein [Mesorhizobium sp.]TIO10685.1 MAG: hypothetical protein E5X88_02600 [Mesorhizobium sp.]TIO35371.1 MAG: hypothetical protein E5X89_08960 [Mesorhizobium sp.]TIP13428.1 MAG: hypothetical protein E5X73_08335 [Mesorhizobium sp.]
MRWSVQRARHPSPSQNGQVTRHNDIAFSLPQRDLRMVAPVTKGQRTCCKPATPSNRVRALVPSQITAGTRVSSD